MRICLHAELCCRLAQSLDRWGPLTLVSAMFFLILIPSTLEGALDPDLCTLGHQMAQWWWIPWVFRQVPFAVTVKPREWRLLFMREQAAWASSLRLGTPRCEVSLIIFSTIMGGSEPSGAERLLRSRSRGRSRKQYGKHPMIKLIRVCPN